MLTSRRLGRFACRAERGTLMYYLIRAIIRWFKRRKRQGS
jgi:hypothetical protein